MAKIYTALGLMSGTSMDGVDACIIKSNGEDKYEVVFDQYFKYEEEIYRKLVEVRNKIHSPIDLEDNSIVLKELDIKIKWKGEGINQKAYDKKGRCIISCNKKYFRPTEVDSLLGNPAKAKKFLKWKPKYKILDMVREMVKEEFKNI